MYGTKYILGFTNDLDELYEIYFDFLDYSGDITQLTGTDDVLTIRATAGDENKLEPILGTEALINIWVEEETNLSIADLVAQHDNDIRITIYRDQDYSKHVYQGFIVVEDNSQPFMDKPYALSVRALDGLGLLKGVDLVDTDNLRFTGSYSVLSWIGQILAKTGQTMNLRTYFNFFEESMAQNIGALEQVFLNAITFSQGDAFNSQSTDPTVDINATTADDCYSALEKIVRCFRCRLFQEDGRWNLVSLYEYLNPGGFSFKEYSFGDPVDGIVPFAAVDSGMNKDYSATIGKEEIIHPVNDDQMIYLKLATKWVKLTYSYDQSQNKICNQDLSEGDRNATYDETISSSIIDPAIQPVVNLQTDGYDAYCWEHLNGTNNGSANNPYPSNAPNSRAFIRSVIDLLEYETQRFLVLEPSSDGKLSYLRSSRFRADVADIVQISFSWRTRVDIHFGGAFSAAKLLLYGDDGSFWSLNTVGDGSVPGNGPVWFVTDANFQQGSGGTPNIGTGFITDTTTNWQSVSANNNISFANPAAKLPVSGTMELLLLISPSASGAQEVWFKDISVTILPYLQGSYRQLKGDYNYSAKGSDIKQTLSEDIQISDSPKRYFKGALLRADGLSLTTTTWRRYGKDENYRFAQLMERVVYNHLYRVVQKMEGTWRGLVYRPADDDSVIIPNGFLGSYMFLDGDSPTKRHMLTSFEKDYHTGQWRGVFVETLEDQNADGFVLPDTYKFSYVFQ